MTDMMSCDICIIGAGIIGSALAYDLATDNLCDVVLLDQVCLSCFFLCILCASLRQLQLVVLLRRGSNALTLWIMYMF